jgi:hypothetical protein
MTTVHILWDRDEFLVFKWPFNGKSNHFGSHTKKLSAHIAVDAQVVLACAADNQPIVGVGLTEEETLAEFEETAPGARSKIVKVKLKDHATTWAEMTKYPRIFDVYWGAFSLPCRPGDEIVANRNKFVDDYGIVKKGGPQYARGDVPHAWDDHGEVYKCKGGFVTVRSPYRGRVGDSPLPAEWTEIAPLYHEEARTIVRFVPGRTRVRCAERATT